MKNNYAYFIAIAAAFAVSCAKLGLSPDSPQQVQRHTLVFDTQMMNTDVRTELIGSDTDTSPRDVYWQVGDSILVFDENNPKGVWSEPLTAADISDKDNKTGLSVGPYAKYTVTLQGDCTGPFYAIYGMKQENVKANIYSDPKATTFDVVLPSGQSFCYNSNGGFVQGENPSIAYCPKAVANDETKAEGVVDEEGGTEPQSGESQEDIDSKKFFFINVCGLIELKVAKPSDLAPGVKLTNAEIYDNTKDKNSKNGYLSGKFQIKNVVVTQDGADITNPNPVLYRNRTGQDGGGARNKNIIFDRTRSDEGADEGADKVYSLYFIAPVGSFHEGFTIILTFSDGSKFKKTLKATSTYTDPENGTIYGKGEIRRGIISILSIPNPDRIVDPEGPVYTANCHLITPPSGQKVIPAGQSYAIPVGYKGNGSQGNDVTKAADAENANYDKANDIFGQGSYQITDGAKAEVIWQTKNDSDATVTEHELISGIEYNNEKKQIIFTATGVEGNALVALKDGRGNIIWSWHLWITNETKENLGVELGNGVVFMDRNLGALSKNPDGGYLTFGQQYQFGRKDPFQAGNKTNTGYDGVYYNMYPHLAINVSKQAISLLGSIASPNTISKGVDSWISNLNETSWGWGEDKKSLWDPCPVGWRIADFRKVFNIEYGTDGLLETISPKSDTLKTTDNGFKLGEMFLPAAGRGEVDNLQFVGEIANFWTNIHGQGNSQARAIEVQRDSTSSSVKAKIKAYNTYYSFSVRCMKWEEPTIETQ